MVFYAKSHYLETIEEHSLLGLDLYISFLSKFGEYFTEEEKKLIYLAIRYHDEGKRNLYFQNIIRGAEGLELLPMPEEEKNIPHGYLSPAFIPNYILNELTEFEKIILFNAIVYHHTRAHEFDEDEIRDYIFDSLNVFLSAKLNTKYLKRIRLNEFDEKEWVQFAIVKGILNKFDYLASSHSLDVEIEARIPIQEKISLFMEGKKFIKNDMQSFLEEHKNQNTIIIASTGSGKTEGSLLWTNGRKTFYTLPLKTSINSMYTRIKGLYGYEEVALLHSDSLNYLMEQEKLNYDTSYNKYKIAKSLSMPLTVCTIDQLITFCYKYLGSEILLATLKYSNIIIDEIQSYSPELISKIIYALKLIKMAGGKFLVMTATLPPVLRYFLNKEGVFTKEDEKNFAIFTLPVVRHKIHIENTDFDYEKIREDSKDKKVLVICNTVKKAQEVYEKLKGEKTWILHSRLVGKDRSEQEERLFKFDKRTGAGIWITTQLVEASIDIDFDVLYTEMSTVDSLLQRLGRCYRKRLYNGNEPNIYIYDTENGIDSVYDETIYRRSVKYLYKYNDDFFTEENKIEYINQVYDTEDNEVKNSDYFKKINIGLKMLKSYFPTDWNRSEAKEKFRDINTVNVIPKVLYDKLVEDGTFDELMDIINGDDNNKKLSAENEIKKYCLSIHVDRKSKEKIYKEIPQLNLKVVDLKYDFDNGYGIGLGFVADLNSEDNYL